MQADVRISLLLCRPSSTGRPVRWHLPMLLPRLQIDSSWIHADDIAEVYVLLALGKQDAFSAYRAERKTFLYSHCTCYIGLKCVSHNRL